VLILVLGLAPEVPHRRHECPDSVNRSTTADPKSTINILVASADDGEASQNVSAKWRVKASSATTHVSLGTDLKGFGKDSFCFNLPSVQRHVSPISKS
jgi:hypothetical protein